MGGFLTRLISLRTEFWSSCQPYKCPMESLLICIFRVHQYVCHLLPGNGFSHPRCKCVICDYISCYFSMSSLPGGRDENMIQLREMIQNVAIKVIFQKSPFLCVQLLCWVHPRSSFTWNNGSRFESWDLRITILDNLEDTSSTVSLWLPSYLISKGNLYPVCGNFEKKALNNFSQWLFFFRVCSLFCKESFSFCFGIGFTKRLRGPIILS